MKKDDLKLLKFPENDLFEEAIKKTLEGISNEEHDPGYYQEMILYELYNFYTLFDDSVESQAILMKIQELIFWIKQFYDINEE